jgi:hypothetical protein
MKLDNSNKQFFAEMLMISPVTNKEIFISSISQTEDGKGTLIIMRNGEGECWHHTIHTEEM